MQQQQAFFFDVYRSGLRAAADLMKTSLESAERMQHQQLDGIRTAMEENVKSTRQLSEVNSLPDLMGVQARFAAAQVEHGVDYWTRLWRSAGETQMALMGQAQSQLGQMGERVREGYALTTVGHERKERKSA